MSDVRLQAFKQFTPEQLLKWVEDMATFLRLAKIGGVEPAELERRG